MRCSHCGHNNPVGERCEACSTPLAGQPGNAQPLPLRRAAMTSPGTSAAPVRLAPMSAAAPALPARQIRGVLVELAGPGTVHHVYEGRNTIGRDPDSSDIVLDEPRISKLHAILVIEQDQAILLDAASANGTRVDGVELRHDKATLPAQSLLQFDERAFAFLFIPQAMFAKLS